MPYIPSGRRVQMRPGDIPTTAGELNYQIAHMIERYLPPQVNYDQLNEVIGVLEACKLEVYRRIVAPYEDRKITENGDVFREGR